MGRGMKKTIVALVCFVLLVGTANAAVFNGYTNITESTLTASDELQVWNSGDIKNITDRVRRFILTVWLYDRIFFEIFSRFINFVSNNTTSYQKYN